MTADEILREDEQVKAARSTLDRSIATFGHEASWTKGRKQIVTDTDALCLAAFQAGAASSGDELAYQYQQGYKAGAAGAAGESSKNDVLHEDAVHWWTQERHLHSGGVGAGNRLYCSTVRYLEQAINESALAFILRAYLSVPMHALYHKQPASPTRASVAGEAHE